MGDSDEEFDSRRREKFRRERNDYQTEPPAVRVTRPPPRRDDWPERDYRPGGPPRRDYREYPPKPFDRPPRAYSPGGRPLDPVSPPPPPKRPRGDWPERGYGGFEPPNFGGFGGGPPHYGGIGGDPGGFPPPPPPTHYPPPYGSEPSGFPRRREPSPRRDWNPMSMPGISASVPVQPAPVEVDYPTQAAMMTFKAFLATQSDDISDEDAIRKYNDYKLEFRRQQINDFFLAHMEEEWFKLKYHPDLSAKRKEEQIQAVKHRLAVFMDLYERKFIANLTVDADMAEGLVRLLDTVVIKLEGGSDHDLKVLDHGPPPDTMVGPSKRELSKGQPSEQATLQAKAKALLEDKEEAPAEAAVPRKKRKRGEDEEGSSTDEDDSGNEDDELVPPGMENKADASGDEEEGKKDVVKTEPEPLDESKDEEEGDKAASDEEVEKVDEEKTKAADEPEPRALHKTASVFLRSIHPAVTKAEIENLCTRYPGFLRAAIADPAPERRWFRRGWITFERNTNCREICWNLNNIRLKDVELGAILNRELARRVRTVSGITCHKSVVRHDIRIAAKVVMNLDSRAGLWKEEEAEGTSDEAATKEGSFGIKSNNPLLSNITEYLIEEASAEEDELVGTPGAGEKVAQGIDLERDEELIAVLDRLILYLRIVHSVDFYNHAEYPNEDEMPNRCGIMHARGIPPMTKLTQKELGDYMKSFEGKMAAFMQPIPLLSEEEAKKFGLKSADDEVEKFLQANTQELAKDKWLCPLSGKKFRGPDFVRKHILNKHEEKIEDVKKDVAFFNNYVRDPKRPALPEHPSSTSGGASAPAAPAAGLGAGVPAVHPSAGLMGTANSATLAALAANPAVAMAIAAAASGLKPGPPAMHPDMLHRFGLGGGRDSNGFGGRGGRDFSPRGGGGGRRGGYGRGRGGNRDGFFGGPGGRKRVYKDLDAVDDDPYY